MKHSFNETPSVDDSHASPGPIFTADDVGINACCIQHSKHHTEGPMSCFSGAWGPCISRGTCQMSTLTWGWINPKSPTVEKYCVGVQTRLHQTACLTNTRSYRSVEAFVYIRTGRCARVEGLDQPRDNVVGLKVLRIVTANCPWERFRFTAFSRLGTIITGLLKPHSLKKVLYFQYLLYYMHPFNTVW